MLRRLALKADSGVFLPFQRQGQSGVVLRVQAVELVVRRARLEQVLPLAIRAAWYSPAEAASLTGRSLDEVFAALDELGAVWIIPGESIYPLAFGPADRERRRREGHPRIPLGGMIISRWLELREPIRYVTGDEAAVALSDSWEDCTRD